MYLCVLLCYLINVYLYECNEREIEKVTRTRCLGAMSVCMFICVHHGRIAVVWIRHRKSMWYIYSILVRMYIVFELHIFCISSGLSAMGERDCAEIYTKTRRRRRDTETIRKSRMVFWPAFVVCVSVLCVCAVLVEGIGGV